MNYYTFAINNKIVVEADGEQEARNKAINMFIEHFDQPPISIEPVKIYSHKEFIEHKEYNEQPIINVVVNISGPGSDKIDKKTFIESMKRELALLNRYW